MSHTFIHCPFTNKFNRLHSKKSTGSPKKARITPAGRSSKVKTSPDVTKDRSRFGSLSDLGSSEPDRSPMQKGKGKAVASPSPASSDGDNVDAKPM